jgi:hypothetical protein
MLWHAQLAAVALAVAAIALPSGASAESTCSYDVATATVQAQMLSARVVISNAGDGRILVDGRACRSADGALDATLATTRQIVVASAFAPATETVVVDERNGRLENRETGRRPKVFALTGAGGDTMEVIGTRGRDRYVAYDDLGASIDLDADADPDFISTDPARVVLYGGPGNDFLRGDRSGDDRLDGGPGNDRIVDRGTAGDRLIGGRGFDTVRADAGDTATGFERP